MPAAPSALLPAATPRAGVKALATAIALVLLVHAGLLWNGPRLLSLGSPVAPPIEAPPFLTRTLPLSEPRVQTPPPATASARAPATATKALKPAAAPEPPVAPVQALPADAPAQIAPNPPIDAPRTGDNAGDTAGVAASLKPPAALPAVQATASGNATASNAAAGADHAAPVASSAQTTPPVQTSQPPQAAAVSTPQTAQAPLQWPTAVRLSFDGRGQERGFIDYYGAAELVWKPAGDGQYEARMDITGPFGLRLATWTSRGGVDSSDGLRPQRFGDRRRGPETATHFQREKGLITFSSNRPEVPLQPGAQDKLSVLLQAGLLLAAQTRPLGDGQVLVFQAADAHRAERWDFRLSGPESLALPGGTLSAWKLTKEPNLEYDQKIELWLAPGQQWLPVRLRITESNGTFSDLLWKSTQKLP